MIFVFYFFAALLVFLSCRSFIGGITYRNFLRDKHAVPRSGYEPFASIIAPCRGGDEEFSENLARLFQQEYRDYEIVFAVDDPEDDAVPEIRRAISEFKNVPAKLIVAAKAKSNAQKAENLREAVLHVAPQSKVFAFVDSDVRISPDWLGRLTAPLANESVGASTGYRWFVSQRPTLANELLSAWNASIASALGPNSRSNFCWGGSTAILRSTFERLNIREKWSSIVAEDFVLTRAVHDAGLDVEFVPHAICASPVDVSTLSLWEFTTRQMKITRVYRSDLWGLSFFGSALFCAVIVAAIVIAIFSGNVVERSIAVATLVVVTIFSVHKSYFRVRSVADVITTSGRELRRHRITHVALFALTPALFLLNSNAALFSRTILWRSTGYKMVSPTETIVCETKFRED